jgi:hypothetical protein
MTNLFSRRDPPEFFMSRVPQKQRAQEKPDALRTRSLACESKKHTSKSPQVRRNNPAFPARMVLTASFALSLVIGLCCHHPRAMQSIVAS